jgi:isoleucyl-tRNA synthetase
LDHFKEKKIVVASNLIETIVKACEIENFKVLKTFKGKDFVGTICSHPFIKMNFNYDVPMLDAQFVNLEQGTGIVHCAPSHGPDDFNLCLKNNIPFSLYSR